MNALSYILFIDLIIPMLTTPCNHGGHFAGVLAMSSAGASVLLMAVEDDQILLAHAQMEQADNQYTIKSVGDAQAIARDIESLSDAIDSQGVIDFSALRGLAEGYCEQEEVRPTYMAVSTFGNVGIGDKIVRHLQNGSQTQGKIIEFDFPREFGKLLDIDRDNFFLDNDATAAALGEKIWGAGKNASDFSYIWAGRGINAGFVVNNDILRGRQHPELGHLQAVRHVDDLYSGSCPSHGDCILGMASIRSIEARKENGNLSDYEITDMVSDYYAQLCKAIALSVAPQSIAIGGYLIRANVVSDLIPAIRRKFQKMMGAYPHYPAMNDMGAFIVPAELGAQASLWGLMEMARRRLSLKLLEAGL